MNSQQQKHETDLRRFSTSHRRAASLSDRGDFNRPASLFQKIYTLTRKIPRGRVATYGQIARALGMPRGARTVGWAMHDCPSDVPWHRVVNAQGKISARPTLGFHTQRTRLQAEGVRFNREGKIDLLKFGWKKL